MESRALLKAVENGTDGTFNVLLQVDGFDHYLMSHRENGLLFMLMKDGITPMDFNRKVRSLSSSIGVGTKRRTSEGRTERKNAFRSQSRRLQNSANHILKVADDYMLYELC